MSQDNAVRDARRAQRLFGCGEEPTPSSRESDPSALENKAGRDFRRAGILFFLALVTLPVFGASTITSIAPASAYAGESVLVMFIGSGLTGITGVSGWGSNAAVSNLVANDSTVVLTLNIGKDAGVGTRELSLTGSNGKTNAVDFQVLAPTVKSTHPAIANRLTAGADSLAPGTPDGTADSLPKASLTGPVLSVSPTALNFGDQPVGLPHTEQVQLTSTGTAAVTVNGTTISGAGFSRWGATFPVTLNPGVAITLYVQFDPLKATADSGALDIASNSSSGSPTQVALSGTGVHWAKLSWAPPASTPVPVAGYNVYRALSGSTSFQRLNSSLITQTAYSDLTVAAGSSYVYYVESVASSGASSVPSNEADLTVP